MTAWTIEAELMRLSKASNPAGAIEILRLAPTISPGEVRLTMGAAWSRGGAETFLCHFQVTSSTGEARSYVLKAVAAYSPGGSIDRILETWVSRRHLLQQAGIISPALYYFGEGVLIEDDIPFSLAEFSLTNSNCVNVAVQLVEYAAALESLGFNPIAPFEDLRTDGRHVIVIDFGEDLGPPHMSTAKRLPSLLEQALTWLSKHGFEVEAHREDLELKFHEKLKSLNKPILNH